MDELGCCCFFLFAVVFKSTCLLSIISIYITETLLIVTCSNPVYVGGIIAVAVAGVFLYFFVSHVTINK